MKQIYYFFLFLFVLTGSNIYAQQNKAISYQYDMAGNRILRKEVTLASNIKRHQPTDSVVIKESLGKRSIKVFPNPTRGALGIEIIGMDTEENIQLILYSGTGTQLHNKPATEGLNPIDMTQYPQGWYILHIVSATERREYKIVKE